LPFSTRAFNVDDTLFIRAAQQIAKHPLDPYGFQINWDGILSSMADTTQNPPLSSYYTALIGSVFGWSERALHCGFILIAILLVTGTYRLAQRFTRIPLLAGLVTLLCPGTLVSASSAMCDTMMLALWVWAIVFWLEGLEQHKAYLLVASSGLIAASALTKYFGVSLIPLLLSYTIMRRRSILPLLWLFIPVAVLVWYQQWTANLYGHGLLFGAADFALTQRNATHGSLIAMSLVGLSFVGACEIFGLFFAPFFWSRKSIIVTAVVSGIGSFLLLSGWFGVGLRPGGNDAGLHPVLTGIQLALFIGSGISLIALAISLVWHDRSANSALLSLWTLGTFFFATYLNYTINARSVYPLFPAAGILVARRFEQFGDFSNPGVRTRVAVITVISGMFSLWILAGDSALGNTAREAASRVMQKSGGATVWFEGHWGFQYYMEALGGHAIDFSNPELKPGDVVVIPYNNIQTEEIQAQFISSQESLLIPLRNWTTTISWQLRAGFYSSYLGPIPYAIGPVPSEKYVIVRIASKVPDHPSR
jgi:hypothetical protein